MERHVAPGVRRRRAPRCIGEVARAGKTDADVLGAVAAALSDVTLCEAARRVGPCCERPHRSGRDAMAVLDALVDASVTRGAFPVGFVNANLVLSAALGPADVRAVVAEAVVTPEVVAEDAHFAGLEHGERLANQRRSSTLAEAERAQRIAEAEQEASGTEDED